MAKNVKQSGRAVSMPAGLLLGAIISIVWTILGAMGLAKMIDNETLGENMVGYGAVIILISAAFIGALVADRRIKHRHILVCGISAGIYYLLLLSITALFFGGQYKGMGVTGLLVLAGSTAALLLGKGKGSGKKKKSYKNHHR